MRISLTFLMYAAWLVAAPGYAQSRAAEPSQPDARAAEPKYESAFRNYAPYRETEPALWREVNDEVGRLGGHVGMFRRAGDDTSKPEAPKPHAGAPLPSAQGTTGQAPARGEPKAPQSHPMTH